MAKSFKFRQFIIRQACIIYKYVRITNKVDNLLIGFAGPVFGVCYIGERFVAVFYSVSRCTAGMNKRNCFHMNVGRNIALRAGLPPSVTAQTVNRFCSSGLQTIAHHLDKLSLLEASQLVKHLEDKWGVSAAAPVAVAAAGAATPRT